MAKLPGLPDLGATPTPDATRPVGSYDVSAFARGAQALAQGAENLGKGIGRVGADLADVAKQHNETLALNAHAGAATELTQLHTRLQNDKDYGTLATRYDDEAKGIVDKWAQTIPDGQLRAHFTAKTGELVAHGAGAIDRQAFNGFVQADDDSRKALLFDVRKDISANPDNPFRGAQVEALHLRIDNAERNGWITKEQAELEKRSAAVAITTTEAQTDATRAPLRFLRETGGLPRGAEALPAYWNKEAANRVAGVSPDLMAVVKRASEISGVQFTVGDKGGTRDQATQDQLVAAGRSQTRNSNHLTGRAVDLIPIVDGKPNPDAAPENFQAISAAMKQASQELGIDVGWGGDWKSFKDVAHFEMAGEGKAPGPGKYGMLDPTTLLRLQQHAQTTIRQQGIDEARIAGQNQLKAAQGWERSLQDAADGRDVLPARKLIEDDPALDEGHRNQLLARRAGIEKQIGAETTRAQADTSAEAEAAYLRNIIDVRSGRGELVPLDTIRDDKRLNEQHRNRILEARQIEEKRLAGDVTAAQADELEHRLINAKAGRAPAPAREEIENNEGLGSHRNRLLAQWDEAAKKNDAYNGILIKFTDPNGGSFNPYDTGEKKNLDAIYVNMGGDMNALQAVVARTGIVPPTAAVQLRGALASSNVQDVLGAAQMARNLIAKNPTIFAGVEGEKDLTDAAVSYAQYTEHFGMTPQAAAQQIVMDNSPEYKARIAKIKNEDIGDIIKKQLAVGDLEKAFNTHWIAGAPNVDFTEGAKQAAFNDYAELFRSKYQETGNVDTAKAQAINQMKTVWGVSFLTGTRNGTLMRYPPERAPAYANVPDAAGKIADDAIAAIKAELAPAGPGLEPNAPAGIEGFTRDKIILTPTAGGETAQAYMAGKPPPYTLSWFDKNGHLQLLNPGRAYVFDPHASAEKTSEERRVGLEAANARTDTTEGRIGADQVAMAHGSDVMAQLGTPEYVQEAARRESQRDHASQLKALDRQEMALEKSGLGGAFREAQRLRIATRRAELQPAKDPDIAAAR